MSHWIYLNVLDYNQLFNLMNLLYCYVYKVNTVFQIHKRKSIYSFLIKFPLV